MEEIQFSAHELARHYLQWNEPIPEFETRYPHALEQCIFAPFQTFKGQLYKGLVAKASILFYLMIKNHPFQNGNKRVAVTALLLFLGKNGKWLSISPQELYNLAKWVAASPATVKNETAKAIEKEINNYLIDTKPFL
jgi:death-on-curing family protein